MNKATDKKTSRRRYKIWSMPRYASGIMYPTLYLSGTNRDQVIGLAEAFQKARPDLAIWVHETKS